MKVSILLICSMPLFASIHELSMETRTWFWWENIPTYGRPTEEFPSWSTLIYSFESFFAFSCLLLCSLSGVDMLSLSLSWLHLFRTLARICVQINQNGGGGRGRETFVFVQKRFFWQNRTDWTICYACGNCSCQRGKKPPRTRAPSVLFTSSSLSWRRLKPWNVRGTEFKIKGTSVKCIYLSCTMIPCLDGEQEKKKCQIDGSKNEKSLYGSWVFEVQ